MGLLAVHDGGELELCCTSNVRHEVVDDEVDEGSGRRLDDLEGAAEGAARTGALAAGGRAVLIALWGDVRHRPWAARGAGRHGYRTSAARLAGQMAASSWRVTRNTAASSSGRTWASAAIHHCRRLAVIWPCTWDDAAPSWRSCPRRAPHVTSPALRCRPDGAVVGAALAVTVGSQEVAPALLELDYGEGTA